MKKDIEWAQKEIDSYLSYEGVDAAKKALVFAKSVINQLDEPEKPLVPKFVADWIESYREKPLVELINDTVYYSDGESEAFRRWFHEEIGFESSYSDFLARAWLDGYTVADEQKYLVSSRESAGFWFLSKNKDNEVVIGTNKDYYDKKWENLKLTEQEIKDYDSRYWAFAVKVEELEE